MTEQDDWFTRQLDIAARATNDWPNWMKADAGIGDSSQDKATAYQATAVDSHSGTQPVSATTKNDGGYSK